MRLPGWRRGSQGDTLQGQRQGLGPSMGSQRLLLLLLARARGDLGPCPVWP